MLPEHQTGNVINLIDQKVLRLDPEYFSYTLAKAALWTATQTMAQALGPRIRVNAIAPGPVLKSEGQSQAEFRARMPATLLQRPVDEADVTAAIGFLLDTPSITGQMIALDAGQHLAWRGKGGEPERNRRFEALKEIRLRPYLRFTTACLKHAPNSMIPCR